MESFKETISVKPENSYPDNVLQEFALISVDKKNAFPIGSYSYRIQKYPSDIDMLEEVIGCCSINEIVNQFVANLQQIIENILSAKNHYFMEVKAGLDDRFIIDYDNYENIVNQINNLYNENLLSTNEYQILSQYPDLEVIEDILRDHLIIRWTADEVLKGSKILPGGKMMTLQEAMKQKSKINIEIIAYVNDRFIDVSNFFILAMKEPNGDVKVINLSQDIYDNFDDYFVRTLKEAISDLLEKGEFFKVIKRMWSLARFEEDKETISRLKQIITGDISLLNQIKSDLGAIIKLYTKAFNPPNELVIKELEDMKDRLANNLLINKKDLVFLNNSLDQAVQLINSNNRIEVIKILDTLMQLFKDIVNGKAETFLSSFF